MTNDKQRERLYYLLQEDKCPIHFWDNKQTLDATDYLLANGAIVPPCKVGDVVWTKYGYTFEVEKIEILKDKKIFRCGNPNTDDYMSFFENEIGTEVFLTKEEAEEALGGVQG